MVEEEEEKKRWYGITNVGTAREEIKGSAKERSQYFSIYIENEKRECKKKLREVNAEEEGVIHRIECKQCDCQIHLRKKNEATQKDVEYSRTNNAIAKHIIETEHDINWEQVQCLKGDKIKYRKKIKEGTYIRELCNRIMNITQQLGLSWCYAKGGGTWIDERGRKWRSQ